MKKRVAAVLVGAALLVLGGPGVGQASASWACVSVDPIEFIACLRNPIPDRPPVELPDRP